MSNKISVIFFGAPGSGKGTQAELLADKLNLFHLDSGDYLRSVIYDPKVKRNRKIQKERKEMEVGGIVDPLWFFRVYRKRIDELRKLDQSLVLSGFGRTLEETFGDKKHQGLMKVLEKNYGKKNIYIFILDIPARETLKRNSHRSVCSVCNAALMAFYKDVKCPFCGGKIIHRKDDKKEAILNRLEEYHNRTQPVFKELKKRGYLVIKIDGTPAPYKIFNKILTYF